MKYLPLFLLPGALLGVALAADTQAIKIDAAAGQPTSLTLGGQSIPLAQGGGFHIFDATDKKDLTLPAGKVSANGDKTVFTTASKEFKVTATFAPQENNVLVTGVVENLRKDDRGYLVDYAVPVQISNPVFSSDLRQNQAITSGTSVETNCFPLAALCGGDVGVALSIPPMDPRVFGIVGSEKGLTMRYYLGLTPKTTNFPNRATFAFTIEKVEPAWGFRSALSQYYHWYPDYYTPRLKKDGLFFFTLGGHTLPNMDQYGYDCFETQLPSYYDSLARDKKYGLTTIPYQIVGQREIKFLPDLPKGYDEAMEIFTKWKPEDGYVFALTKENAWRDTYLKQEVETSAVKFANGNYALAVRHTLWGGNSVTFKINPNPDLFKGQGLHTVGGDAIQTLTDWIKKTPQFGGAYIDSLGANWPAVLNYRADHFAYARYPLTVDPSGRVAIDNALSHYEYMDAVRTLMRKSDRIFMGNGVYSYTTKAVKKGAPAGLERQVYDTKKNEQISVSAPAETYRGGAKVSRFFLAALLDVASCENGVRATVTSSQDCRVQAGPKQYTLINYLWTDKGLIDAFMNRSLCYAIFPTTTSNFETSTLYENHPNGYLRDKPIIDWCVPLTRRLSQAGWEPVRYADISGVNVVGERFGHGDTVYFTMFNDDDKTQQGTLTIDLKSLGFPETAVLTEIARNTPLTPSKPGVVSFPLEAKRCYIIQVTKTAVAAN